MSRRKRTIIALVVIELVLAGAWIWFHNLAMISPNAQPESVAVIDQVFGGAMGLILALSPFLYLFARSNDRRQAATREP